MRIMSGTCGVKGWPGAHVQMVDADRCGVRMSGDGALTPHRVTSGSVVSSSNGLHRPQLSILNLMTSTQPHQGWSTKQAMLHGAAATLHSVDVLRTATTYSGGGEAACHQY